MSTRTWLLALTGAVLAGCGGGDGSTIPDSPKGAVQAFTAAVGKDDWKGACKVVAREGQAHLAIVLHVDPNAEEDQFGLLKDCSATLERHAAELRTVIKGADPGAVQQQSGAKVATVSSPKGAWRVVIEENSTKWQIADFPR